LIDQLQYDLVIRLHPCLVWVQIDMQAHPQTTVLPEGALLGAEDHPIPALFCHNTAMEHLPFNVTCNHWGFFAARLEPARFCLHPLHPSPIVQVEVYQLFWETCPITVRLVKKKPAVYSLPDAVLPHFRARQRRNVATPTVAQPPVARLAEFLHIFVRDHGPLRAIPGASQTQVHRARVHAAERHLGTSVSRPVVPSGKWEYHGNITYIIPSSNIKYLNTIEYAHFNGTLGLITII
jgi:hypothetical protein